MPKHAPRYEIVHTGKARFHVRFIGGNGEPVVSGESLTRKRAAYKAIEAVTGESVRHAPGGATVLRAGAYIEIREVDERLENILARATKP